MASWGVGRHREGQGKGEGRQGGCARKGCLRHSLDSRKRARARALWVRSPYYECNVWGYSMQFSRRWTSVVVPVAMLIKYVFARII
eukprot:scaffold66600_cov62-Phaeocystis_antarctica.AAC.2